MFADVQQKRMLGLYGLIEKPPNKTMPMLQCLKPRSHEGLGPCYDLCKTSHVVKSQVDLIRARDRS